MSDELKTDWFCPTCNCYIDGRQVTNDERHETCGTRLGGIDVPALQAEVARYKSLADELAGDFRIMAEETAIGIPSLLKYREIAKAALTKYNQLTKDKEKHGCDTTRP